MLIAIEPLPTGVAACLTRDKGQTVMTLDGGLSTIQIVRAENLAFNREGPAVVVMREEL